MKQTIITVFLITALVAGLFYIGGYVLLVGLGTIALTGLIFSAFFLGSLWTKRMIQVGTEITIRVVEQNNTHDTVKIKALADLTQETVKAKNQAVPPATNGYPRLPPFNAIDGHFTIAGLEGDDTEP